MNEFARVGTGVTAAPGRTSVPFDLATAVADGAWRQDFRWPLAHMALREHQLETVSAILDLAAAFPDVARRGLALLVQGPLGNLVRTLGEIALLAEAAARENIEFVGTPPEFECLVGRLPLSEINLETPARKKDANLGFTFGRRLARMASWTRSPLRLSKAIFAPDHVAITHNAMMQSFAARSAHAISFRHAEEILQQGRALAPERGDEVLVCEVVERYEQVIRHCYPVASAMVERMTALFRQNANSIVERSARDLEGLKRLPEIPRSVWAGSAGPYAVRAIAIEVRRRGGKITAFDHGGSLGMMDEPFSIALRELSVTDQYVMPTQGCVDTVTRTETLAASRPFGMTELVAGSGDPTFRVAPQSQRRTTYGKPRIYYIITIFRALRQLVPTLLPDPIYLDWQIKLVEAMRSRGIDVICKPHPEGILKGKRHPLGDIATVEYRPFEQIRDNADSFLYDYSQSTTFWEAVCTDRPVTLVDFGITRFNQAVAPMIERRCRVIRARWDDRNLPTVDFGEVADALNEKRAVDPSEFRRLLAGA